LIYLESSPYLGYLEKLFDKLPYLVPEFKEISIILKRAP